MAKCIQYIIRYSSRSAISEGMCLEFDKEKGTAHAEIRKPDQPTLFERPMLC